MMTKNVSPIIDRNARVLVLTHSDFRRREKGEHSELLLIAAFCFLAYGLFVYFTMPTAASTQYSRAFAELSYHWRNAFDAFEYRYYTSYLPYVQSLLQDGMAYIWR